MGAQNTHKRPVASPQSLVAETEGAEGTAAIEFVASAQSFRLSDKWNIASVIVEATPSLLPFGFTLSELPRLLSQLRHQVNHLAGCLLRLARLGARCSSLAVAVAGSESESDPLTRAVRPTHWRNKTIGVHSMQVASVKY